MDMTTKTEGDEMSEKAKEGGERYKESKDRLDRDAPIVERPAIYWYIFYLPENIWEVQ